MSSVPPGHMHGNVNNDTDITRVINMRILVEGEPYHRRLQVDSFDFLGTINLMYSKIIQTGNSLHMMVGQVLFHGQYHYPEIKWIITALKRMDVYPLENEYNDWCPSLQHYISERPDGIVMLSMFSLPDKKEWRNKILNMALEYGVELHFANEYIVLKTQNDLQLIQDDL